MSLGEIRCFDNSLDVAQAALRPPIHCPKEAEMALKMGSRWSKKTPKMAPDGHKTGPRWPQAKKAQEGPRWLQDSPRWLQAGPRRPKIVPRLPPDCPRWLKRAQYGPKRARDRPKMAPRSIWPKLMQNTTATPKTTHKTLPRPAQDQGDRLGQHMSPYKHRGRR
jgi:hypothetical protein